ncbi:23S rRNA pseudouridine1911/1915/1917 synthase [Strigomonas culicis]|uniref:23S rRNA pseudouridine1911/1915/1917 synthase n=1 Tax=Strigomonas culicis TaxID=28005 RepID=S9V7Y9_9TRYP|nr:23S rRNA pseudouridine1911/1915/1917 synthase [Strigomonas culicis]|eukprot:EPY23071.1 23S rRNA pseudouridine1911/1915/1917 synthase [Strigomonas culicis]
MGRTFCYSRPKKDLPETLISYLCVKFPYFTREQWIQQIECGNLRVERKPKHQGKRRRRDGEGDDALGESSGPSGVLPTVPDQILEQSDLICYDPPRQLEPEVDATHLEVLYEGETSVVVVKNGCLPVTEGGRYCRNTLIHILNELPSLSSFYTERTVVSLRLSATPEATLNMNLNGERQTGGVTRYWSVHRLDKETSGVLLVAKNVQTAAGYAQQFMSQAEETVLEEGALRPPEAPSPHRSGDVIVCNADEKPIFTKAIADKPVCKTYYAVLSGAAPVGTVPQYRITYKIGLLWEDEANRTDAHVRLKKLKMMAYPSDASVGKPACTFITVLASDTALGVSFARISLLTGRTHQIRVHCAALGFPVLGDKLYSTATPGVAGHAVAVADSVYLARAQDTEKRVFLPDHLQPRWCCRRHLLHAGALAFTHAETQQRVRFTALCAPWFLPDVRGRDEAEDAALSHFITAAYAKEPQDERDTL